MAVHPVSVPDFCLFICPSLLSCSRPFHYLCLPSPPLFSPSLSSVPISASCISIPPQPVPPIITSYLSTAISPSGSPLPVYSGPAFFPSLGPAKPFSTRSCGSCSSCCFECFCPLQPQWPAPPPPWGFQRAPPPHLTVPQWHVLRLLFRALLKSQKCLACLCAFVDLFTLISRWIVTPGSSGMRGAYSLLDPQQLAQCLVCSWRSVKIC